MSTAHVMPSRSYTVKSGFDSSWSSWESVVSVASVAISFSNGASFISRSGKDYLADCVLT